MKKLLRNKWLWIGGVVLLLLIGGLILARNGRNATAQAQTGETVTAFIGDLSASATASGKVVAQRDARLALTTSGTVEQLLVEVGDAVETGDILLQLDTTELERSVLNAEQNLAIAESNLATLTAPPNASDVASAEAAVASAQAQLDDLLDGPNEDEVASAEASLRAANADLAAANARLTDLTEAASPEEIEAAQIQLELAQKAATTAAEQHSTALVMEPNRFLSENRIADIEYAARIQAVQANADLAAAQEAYDAVVNGNSNDITAAQANVALAVASRNVAQAQLDMLREGASEANIAAARSSLAQAEATLDQLRRGPSEVQLATAMAQVEQAQIALQQAQNNLADATLTAPFAGVVTAVSVSEGELASGIVMEMVDRNSLEVVLDVDEVDIGKVSIGQPATVTLETWPDTEISAEVVAIAPKQKEQTGSALVVYEVNLRLGETDLPILVGMTANASLVTAETESVLLVPNEAITPDRQRGQYFVNKLQPDGTSETVEVTTGLRDGDYTQVTSGLEEGDTLIIGSNLPTFEFGPGSGPPGGGGRSPFGNN